MTVTHEPMNLADLLKQEAANYYSRDVATLAAGQHLQLGAVIAKRTEDSKITALDLTHQESPSGASPTGPSGAEVAYGILMQETDASSADQETIVIARDAVVSASALIWPSAITAAEKTAAINQLKERGILVRKGA